MKFFTGVVAVACFGFITLVGWRTTFVVVVGGVAVEAIRSQERRNTHSRSTSAIVSKYYDPATLSNSTHGRARRRRTLHNPMAYNINTGENVSL